MQNKGAVNQSSTNLYQIKAIAWDMDGTLVDTEPTWQSAEEELMAEFGYIWLDEDSAHCIGGPMERVARYLQKKSGTEIPFQWFGDQLIARMKAKLSTPPSLLPGVLSLLTEIKNAGLKQAIVSASDRGIVDLIYSSFPDYFDFAISANDVKDSKPSPDCYLLAAKKFDININEMLIIEDSFVGISAGMATGALVIALPHSPEIPQGDNVFTFPSLENMNLEGFIGYHQAWQLNKVGD
jgi:HAD superfamily hydrolase (TIGR01509 family)